MPYGRIVHTKEEFRTKRGSVQKKIPHGKDLHMKRVSKRQDTPHGGQARDICRRTSQQSLAMLTMLRHDIARQSLAMFAMFRINYIRTLIYQHVFSLIVFNFHTNLNIYFIQLINKLLLVLLHIAPLYTAQALGYLRLYESFIIIAPAGKIKNQPFEIQRHLTVSRASPWPKDPPISTTPP
jgi:hypothetical protein